MAKQNAKQKPSKSSKGSLPNRGYTTASDKFMTGVDKKGMEKLAKGDTSDMMMSVFKDMGGGSLLAEAKNVLVSDLTYTLAAKMKSHVASTVVNGLDHVPIDKVREFSQNANQDQIADAFVLGAQAILPTIDAAHAVTEDARLRHQINQDLVEYIEAGEDGIAPTSIADGQHTNKILDSLIQYRINPMFMSDALKAGATAATSFINYGAHKLDEGAQKDKAEEMLTQYKDEHNIVDTITPSAENGAEASTQNKNLKTYNDLSKEQKNVVNSLEKFTPEVRSTLAAVTANPDVTFAKGRRQKIYEGTQPFTLFNNMTGLATLGSGFVGGKLKESINHATEGVKGVLAYDLIMYLKSEVDRGAVQGDKIDLQKFTTAVPNHKFIKNDLKGEVTIAEFVEEIFHQHVVDQNPDSAVDGVSPRYAQELKEVSAVISDAITGKGLQDATLNPIALIKIIGENNIVGVDGFSVASEHAAMSVVNDALEQFQYVQDIDAQQFLININVSSAQLSAIYDALLYKTPRGSAETSRDAAALTLLMPSSVMTDCLSSSISAAEAKKRKDEFKELAPEVIPDLIYDFSSQKDYDLMTAGLSVREVRLVREAAKQLDKNNWDAVETQLQEPDGLRAALLVNKGYWQQLANGDMEIGDLSGQANNIVKSTPKEETAQDSNEKNAITKTEGKLETPDTKTLDREHKGVAASAGKGKGK